MILDTGPGLLATTSPEALLFCLLLAGHLLGDFLFQTRRMLARKDRGPGLLAHAATVLAVHAAVLAPMITLPVASALLAVTGTHAAIDRAKMRWRRQVPGPLGLFLADQALHVGVLAGTFVLLSATPPHPCTCPWRRWRHGPWRRWWPAGSLSAPTAAARSWR